MPVFGTTNVIALDPGPRPSGDFYFALRLQGGLANFKGGLFRKRGEALLSASVAVRYPTEPAPAHVESVLARRAVERDKALRLGVSTTLLEFTPSNVEQVSCGLQLTVRSDSSLAPIAKFIEEGGLVAPLSVVEPAATVARTVTSVVTALHGMWPTTEDDVSINFGFSQLLQDPSFAPGTYVVMASNGETPLPTGAELTGLEYSDALGLFKDKVSIDRWPYVVLRVIAIEARTRETAGPVLWSSLLTDVDRELSSITSKMSVSDADVEQAEVRCATIIDYAARYIESDLRYHPNERRLIIENARREVRRVLTGLLSGTELHAIAPPTNAVDRELDDYERQVAASIATLGHEALLG